MNAIYSGRSFPTFRQNVLPPSTVSKGKESEHRYVCCLLLAYLAYFSNLKMDAVRSSETSINF
jgi:hypothetical protein